MSNANEEIQNIEMDKEEIRSLIGLLHLTALSKGYETMAGACSNFLGQIIAELPEHAQAGGVEALMQDIQASIKDRNKARLSRGH